MGRPVVNLVMYTCFIIDLQMQHMICCVDLIGRKLENMKHDPNNTHRPYNFSPT